MDKLSVGKKIYDIRNQKGLTQKQLAEQLYVSDKAVSKWERGLNYPDIELLERLAAVLDITMIELLDIKEKTTNEVIKEISIISAEEKKLLKKEIKNSAVVNLIFLVILFAAEMIVSWQFNILGIRTGIPVIVSWGMIGLVGSMIGNILRIISKIKRM